MNTKIDLVIIGLVKNLFIIPGFLIGLAFAFGFIVALPCFLWAFLLVFFRDYFPVWLSGLMSFSLLFGGFLYIDIRRIPALGDLVRQVPTWYLEFLNAVGSCFENLQFPLQYDLKPQPPKTVLIRVVDRSREIPS